MAHNRAGDGPKYAPIRTISWQYSDILQLLSTLKVLLTSTLRLSDINNFLEKYIFNRKKNIFLELFRLGLAICSACIIAKSDILPLLSALKVLLTCTLRLTHINNFVEKYIFDF